MGPPDGDHPAVVVPQRLVPGPTRAGKDLPRPPRHVAAVVGPVPAAARHLLAVIDHGDARHGELEDRCQAEAGHVAVQERQRTGNVMRRQEVRHAIARTDLLAGLQVAVEGHGAAPSQQPADDAPLECEVEAGVHLVACEPGVEDLGSPRPRPRRGGRSRCPRASRLRRRCSFQNGWSTCLTVSSRKPSIPDRFAHSSWAPRRKSSTSGSSVLKSGRPDTQRGEVVRAAGAGLLGAEPALGPGIRQVVRVVARRGCRPRREARGCRAAWQASTNAFKLLLGAERARPAG